ncbi:MAG: TrkA C-terminal domain-containing protein, partial [Mariprofundaceae bacterium]
HLLREKRIAVPPSVGHVDLIALLQSGVPVDLARNQQMLLCSLRPDAPFVGRRLKDVQRFGANVDIVAIMQQGQWRHPSPDSVLSADDQLLLVMDAEARQRLQPMLVFRRPASADR